MSYPKLIQSFGFDNDPFATTNADEEDQLENYFIEPPFFKAVYGDIHNPKSVVVFAPRGGGKTALKRRIELFARTDSFLCVTYNNFPLSSQKLADIDLDYHLKSIARLLLVAVLGASTSNGIEELSADERHFLYLLTKAHLNGIDNATLRESINAVKSISQKARERWNQLIGPVGIALNVLLAHFGFKPVEISQFAEVNAQIGGFKEQISLLTTMAKKFGFASTYILIDKVDETQLTGNKASSSLRFIKPILSDLSLLETPGLAVKLFLWDAMADEASEITRPDRIKQYQLRWTFEQLAQMLSKRLAAYSQNQINSLHQMTRDALDGLLLDTVVVALSAGSPRNIIRICKAIFDQQSEIDASANHLSAEAIIKGVDLIAAELAKEAIPAKILQDLRKMQRTDFTGKNVYSDTFKITQQAGLSKVKLWQDSGAVIRVGTRQESSTKKSSYVYAISNPIIAKYIFSEMGFKSFFTRKMMFCGNCREILMRDWEVTPKQLCHHCQAEMDASSFFKSN